MPSFEMNQPDWYTPIIVDENDYLNNLLEDDKYGRWYSVTFEGDAGTFLWMAKTAPVVGDKYYGHLEQAKSGKSVKFKKDKIPEGELAPQGANKQSAQYSENTDQTINRQSALKSASSVYQGTSADSGEVIEMAELFLAWIKNDLRLVTPKTVDKIFNGKEPMPEMPEDFLEPDAG